MSAHIHAALMLEYAKDAMETDRPWERWEYFDSASGWTQLRQHPNWIISFEYRRRIIPLCQVEGKDVFAGDRLWHVIRKNWYVITSRHGNCLYSREDGFSHSIESLSWSEPVKNKTVYQWTYRVTTDWLITNRMFETESEFREYYRLGDSVQVRRLDYTATEVPTK